ncbi:hypothetical protein [Polyangium aurulentum]|uniref:hypothetical protein n=1 Tax=Polyangium aurulentum TaxID=2567896 RepID=UPI0010AEBC9E|nr:hypothetical protein [Polyangium aurulentum]UQA61985.1 hypothetical protein E8A73_016525 [Polyangium aurulentum]
MYRFQRRAPLEAIVVDPPPVDVRSGPPLDPGAIFLMIATVGADHLPPETLALLDGIDPDAFYHGQLLETILNELEDRDPSLPAFVGRGIYYMFRPLMRQLGIRTAEEGLRALPTFYQNGTRGDSGEWRVEIKGPGHARLEADQPYNCHFEEGGLVGLLEGLDATDVTVDHVQCVRKGAPICVFEVRFREGAGDSG